MGLFALHRIDAVCNEAPRSDIDKQSCFDVSPAVLRREMVNNKRPWEAIPEVQIMFKVGQLHVTGVRDGNGAGGLRTLPQFLIPSKDDVIYHAIPRGW